MTPTINAGQLRHDSASSGSTGMMTNPLEDLPGELLQNVLTAFDFNHARGLDYKPKKALRVYRNLTLTSRTLRAVATPLLYRFFKNDRDGRIRGYVNTICTNPNIAVHVRTVTMLLTSRRQQDALSNDQLDRFATTLSRKMLADRTAFYRIANALAHGCYAAQLLVLFVAATRLRALRIFPVHPSRLENNTSFCTHDHAGCEDFYRWLHALLLDGEVRSQYSLLELVMVGGFHTTPTSHRDIAALLFLPALKRFSATGLDSTAATTLPWPQVEASNTLDTIILANAHVDGAALCEMVGSTKVLRHLEISWGQPEGRPVTVSSDISSLLPILSRHRARLEHLQLVALDGQNGHLFQDAPALGPLVAFDSLKTLIINDHWLADFNFGPVNLAAILPPSLEQLFINMSDLEVDTIAAVCTSFANFTGAQLKSVGLNFPMYDVEYARVFNLNGPLNENDVAGFCTWSPKGGRARLMLLCETKPEHVAGVLTGFGRMLEDEGLQLLEYMFWKQAYLARGEDGQLSVLGYEELKRRNEEEDTQGDSETTSQSGSESSGSESSGSESSGSESSGPESSGSGSSGSESSGSESSGSASSGSEPSGSESDSTYMNADSDEYMQSSDEDEDAEG